MPKAILESEMPESCSQCPCAQYYDTYGECGAIEYDIDGDFRPVLPSEGRRPDCPLKLVEGKDEQTNVKCRHCNSESVEIIARGTESILYKCKVCKMEFAKLNIKEVES